MISRGKLVALLLAATVIGMLLSPGAVQAATNYFNTTKIVTGHGTATCPRGWRVTGGGPKGLKADTFYSDGGYDTYQLLSSFPVTGRKWRVVVEHTYYNGNGVIPQVWDEGAPVYAICTR